MQRKRYEPATADLFRQYGGLKVCAVAFLAALGVMMLLALTWQVIAAIAQ